MKTQEQNECLVCGESDWHVVKNKPDYDVVMCKCCTFTQLFPLPTQEELAIFYRNAYREKYSLGEFVTKELLLQEKVRADSIVPHLKEFPDEITSHLDVGCSTGTLVSTIMTEFPTVNFNSAIELNENFRQYVNSNKILNDPSGVQSKPVEECDEISDERYNLCTLVHVLEHTRNPLLTLQAIYKKMSVNGLFYVEVPNLKTPYNWLDSKYFVLYHLYYFTDSTLRLMLDKVGFKIEKEIIQHNTSIAYVCRKVELKNTHRKEREYDSYLEVDKILKQYRVKSLFRNVLVSLGARKIKKIIKELL